MSTLSIFDAVDEAPHSAAIVIGNEVWTFADVAQRVRRRMGELGRDNTTRPVALVGASTLETLETLYALFELRRPALLLHPRWTAEERNAVASSPGSLPALDAASDESEAALAILFTSGTTGLPRGVVLSRRAFLAAAAASAENLGWTDDDRWLLALPLAHVGGLSVVTRCLLARRAVVIPPALARNEHLGLDDLVECVESSRVTLLSLVPTQLAWLLDRSPTWDPPQHVRTILLGGAAASPKRLAQAMDRQWPVLTTYGLTETCSQVSTLPFGAKNAGLLGAGLPLRGTEVRIAAGVIEVRGPALMSGYYPRPADAAPWDWSHWFSTNDYGFFDEAGCLHVLGRGGEMIITGGENVHPVDVENAIERMPMIRQACVFGVDDETWGQIVATALVLEDGATFDEPAVAAHVRSALATFKRPRRYAVLDALALGPNGKVDRAATASKARRELAPLRGI